MIIQSGRLHRWPVDYNRCINNDCTLTQYHQARLDETRIHPCNSTETWLFKTILVTRSFSSSLPSLPLPLRLNTGLKRDGSGSRIIHSFTSSWIDSRPLIPSRSIRRTPLVFLSHFQFHFRLPPSRYSHRKTRHDRYGSDRLGSNRSSSLWKPKTKFRFRRRRKLVPLDTENLVG